MNNIDVNTEQLIHWFNALRNLEHQERTRLLDSFWSGQLQSKAWLVNTLNQCYDRITDNNIYIFGGWTGILSNLLFNSSRFGVGKIRSIDIDPWCEGIADTVNREFEMDSWRFKARTADMAQYEYEWDSDGNFITPHIVINTSTEHVNQKTYDRWYDKIPKNTVVIAQGNDFFVCEEHIRCSHNLEQFNVDNHVVNPIYTGFLTTDMYTRWMSIWIKNA